MWSWLPWSKMREWNKIVARDDKRAVGTKWKISDFGRKIFIIWLSRCSAGSSSGHSEIPLVARRQGNTYGTKIYLASTCAGPLRRKLVGPACSILTISSHIFVSPILAIPHILTRGNFVETRKEDSPSTKTKEGKTFARALLSSVLSVKDITINQKYGSVVLSSSLQHLLANGRSRGNDFSTLAQCCVKWFKVVLILLLKNDTVNKPWGWVSPVEQGCVYRCVGREIGTRTESQINFVISVHRKWFFFKTKLTNGIVPQFYVKSKRSFVFERTRLHFFHWWPWLSFLRPSS